MNFRSGPLVLFILTTGFSHMHGQNENLTGRKFWGADKTLLHEGDCKAIITTYNPVSCKACYTYLDKELEVIFGVSHEVATGIVNITGVSDLGRRKDIERYLNSQFEYFHEFTFGIPLLDSIINHSRYLPDLILIDQCKKKIVHIPYEEVFEGDKIVFTKPTRKKLNNFKSK